MEKIDKKDKLIRSLRKMIDDKRMIHDYIKSGKPLSELKTKEGINFFNPL